MKVDIDTYDDARSMRLHRLGWRLQLAFYLLLITVLVTALLGLFGDGFLSERRVELGSGITVRYQHFIRAHSQTELTIVRQPTGKNQALELDVPLSFYEKYTVSDLRPDPQRQGAHRSMHAYVFDSTAGENHVYFRMSAQSPGSVELPMRIDGQSFTFRQYVWP